MGYRRPDVACCLNVAADHLGLRGINTLEQLAEVKRIPIEVATDTVVLNADDPLCLQMAAHSSASNIAYVTLNPQHALVREHIRAGGRAIALEPGLNGDMITLYDNGSHMPLLWTHLVPATLEGKAIHNVQNAMFAAGMAYAMGVKLDDIRHGLRTFDTTWFQAPGRMNIYDKHGFRVICDYGHNPAAIDAMCTLVDRLADEQKSKKIVVLSVPGDRRDEDIAAVARRAAKSFDHFICRRDDARRGRGEDEVPALLRKFLLEEGISNDAIDVVVQEPDAVNHALTSADPGDLVLIFCDGIKRTWKQVIYFGSDRPETRPSTAEVSPAASTPAPPASPEPTPDENWARDGRGVFLIAAQEDD
jgi:cyanophycin synthetase